MPLVKIQSFLLSLILIVLLCGCSGLNIQSQAEKENIQNIVNKTNNSKLIVLDVYHNRCETCKVIEPVFEKLQLDYLQNSDIVFLKYDLSNPFTIIKSRRIATALGLESIYKSQRYSGIVLFIDSKTKQVVDTLIGESDVKKYSKIVEEVLNKKVSYEFTDYRLCPIYSAKSIKRKRLVERSAVQTCRGMSLQFCAIKNA